MDPLVNNSAQPLQGDALVVEIHKQVRTIAGNLMSHDRADDVTQDVLLDCLERMRDGTWNVAPEHLEAHLVCVVLRRRSDTRKRRGRTASRDAHFLKDISASTHTWMHQEAKLEQRELTALYEEVLSALGPMCRRAFVLVREAGLSYAEAAEELGVSEKSVAAQITRAQRVFRDVLRERAIVVPMERLPSGIQAEISADEDGVPPPGDELAAARVVGLARNQVALSRVRGAAAYFRAELERRELEERDLADRELAEREFAEPDATA